MASQKGQDYAQAKATYCLPEGIMPAIGEQHTARPDQEGRKMQKSHTTVKGRSAELQGQIADLGERLRYHREHELHRSLTEVAARSEVSRSTLSGIESGAANPGLEVLLKALKGYDLTGLPDLLCRPRSPAGEHPVVRWNTRARMSPRSSKTVYVGLGACDFFELKPRATDPQLMVAIGRIPPLSSTRVPAITDKHGGDEVIMALKGSIELVRRRADGVDEIHSIREGELLVHRATVEHHARNPSRRKKAEYLVVRAQPSQWRRR